MKILLFMLTAVSIGLTAVGAGLTPPPGRQERSFGRLNPPPVRFKKLPQRKHVHPPSLRSVSARDMRYPAWMEKHVLPCPAEGYFLHPADDSWFYRCLEVMGSGLYKRYIFQCDPRSKLITDTNRCDFSYFQELSFEMKMNSSLQSMISISLTEIQQIASQDQSQLQPHSIANITKNKLTELISTDDPNADPNASDGMRCVTRVGGCRYEYICLDSIQEDAEVHVCRRAVVTCTEKYKGIATKEYKYAVCEADDMSFDRNFQYCVYHSWFGKCIRPPSTSEKTIFGPPAPPQIKPGPPAPITEKPSPSTTKRPIITTTTTTEKPLPITTTTEKPLPTTTTTEKPLPTTTTEPPTTTTIAGTTTLINVGFNATLECSSTSEIPWTEWIRKTHCQVFYLCSTGGIFKKVVELCDKFFECRKNNDGWYAMPMSCPNPWKFSFHTGYCEDTPRESERC